MSRSVHIVFFIVCKTRSFGEEVKLRSVNLFVYAGCEHVVQQVRKILCIGQRLEI